MDQKHPILKIGTDDNEKDPRSIFHNFNTALVKKLNWIRNKTPDFRLDKTSARHNPAQHFLNQHGILYCREQYYQKNPNYQKDNVIALLKGFAPDVSGVSMSHFETEEFEYYSYLGRTTLFHSKGYGTACFFEFNEDFDFLNRDFNLRLQDFSAERPDVSELYDKLKQKFTNMGDVLYNPTAKELLLYGETHCYEIKIHKHKCEVNFVLQAIPKREGKDGYQIAKGHHIYKIPKRGIVEASAEEIFGRWEKYNLGLKKLNEQYHQHLIEELA